MFSAPPTPSYIKILELSQKVLQGLEVVHSLPARILDSVGEDAATQHIPPWPLTLGWTDRALALYSPPFRNSSVLSSLEAVEGKCLELWPLALLCLQTNLQLPRILASTLGPILGVLTEG